MGWAVLEDDAVVEVCRDRDQALGIIQLLDAVARSTGRSVARREVHAGSTIQRA